MTPELIMTIILLVIWFIVLVADLVDTKLEELPGILVRDLMIVLSLFALLYKI